MEVVSVNRSTQLPVQKHEVDCPVCQATDYQVLYKPRTEIDDPIALYGAATGVQGTQTIVKCNKCTMIYENPQFPETTILKGYQSSQEAGHDSQFEMRVNSFVRSLNSLSKHLPPKGSRILDIGSAGGAFLVAAQRYGYQVVGLEPSQFLVDQAQKRGLEVYAGTIEQHTLPRQGFDMVCLWDVLEHVVDPARSLQLIRPLLRDNGVLLINYPDIGTWQAKAAGEKFWWILSNHLHYFTRRTIREICSRNGFDVFLTTRYWQTLTFGYLMTMAAHLKVPTAKLFLKIVPQFIQNIPVSYYASQTTALARVKK